MDKLRLRFEKTGRAIYISHLDLMHTMQRAFSRAGYELKYSEGFNPHPQISTALPMSLGMTSYCELADFKLTEDVNISELPARLTAALPEGITVTECYEPEIKFARIRYLAIEGRLEYDNTELSDVTAELSKFFSADEIVIVKKTKRGEGESNIRPAIKSMELSQRDGAVCINAVISAQEPTLNPELLISALRQKRPELVPDFYEFKRIECYDEKMQPFR